MNARPQPMACPACVPIEPAAFAKELGKEQVLLSLPGIHCAGCISAVERGLAGHEGVRGARVNLSLKRVAVETQLEPDELIGVLAGIGYEAHELQSEALNTGANDKISRNLLLRLGVAGFAAMNVMLFSVAVWSGAEGVTRDFLHWVSAAIALPAIAYAAQPFFINAWRALGVGRLNMDVPISLAILLACAMSLFETFQGGAHAYFDAALSLTFFLLAGRYLDHRTRASARSAAQELAALEVPNAVRLLDGVEETVAVKFLAIGDLVRIRPGGRVPVDGVIIEGSSEIDRSMLTGESLPVFAGVDTNVQAGEINLTGPLTLRVTAAAEDSTLQKISALVALAETSRNKYTSLADKAAAIYAPGVHLLAAVALIGWFVATGDLRLAINIAVAVLIITCPCALGLAVPAVTTAASGSLFRRGVLLKNGTALERLAEVDTVVFDKTGTLTLGTPKLLNADDHPLKVLRIAKAMAQGSAHPLAGALGELAVKPVEISDLKEVPGFGVEGLFDGQTIRLGRADWVGAVAVDQTATYLKIGDGVPVSFTFEDQLRDGAEQAVAGFLAQRLDVHLMSGDTAPAVQQIASKLGIPNLRANMTPDQKAAEIAAFQAAGKRVLMVGDGLNDTAALTQAHVSISPASAIDAARVASDIVILGKDISVLNACLKTARSARARIKENFAIAAAYNLIAVPVALAGFATPLIAALAMSASSITVSLNAWRVR